MVVYDLGGGTFDVTVLRIRGKDLTVLATAGDVRLGGRDWDERLFNYMAEQFQAQHGLDPRDDPMSRQALMLQAEETKKILSNRQQTRFVVTHAGKSFNGQITREQFDEMTADLLYRSETRLERVMEQAKLDWSKIDQVLATGGSTRMPQVQEMLTRIGGKEANVSLSPDEAVAQGAAIYAAMSVVKEHRARSHQYRRCRHCPSQAQQACRAPHRRAHRRCPKALPPPTTVPFEPPTGGSGILRQMADKAMDLLPRSKPRT